MPNVITIGRQFGSGGHEVGSRLAKKMGIPFYDKEILTLTAKNSRFAESYLEKMDEQKPSFLNIGSAGLMAGAGGTSSAQGAMTQFYNLSPNDQIFLETSKVMHSLAAKGPCVIVGRCAEYIHDRVARKLALEEHSEHDEQSMEKLILQTDKSRSKYYEYYSHEVWGAAENYHMCINTSVVGVDGAVAIILKFIEEFRKKNLMPDK